jgi:formylglycine-generating enzyme required for sulfatase activity
MDAGGYQDPRWWPTETARAWIRGENTSTPDRMVVRYWLARFRRFPDLLGQYRDAGSWPKTVCDGMARRLEMNAQELEDDLAETFPSIRFEAPLYWEESRYSHPGQPVVGISQMEARAYALWLSANSGRVFRLPTEIELEAAARGLEGRRYACGNELPLPFAFNSMEVRIGGPTPIGVFPESDTPEGIADLMGNVLSPSISRWGDHLDHNDFRYPYDAEDGREVEDPGETACFVPRGGAYSLTADEAVAYRRYSAAGLFMGRNTGMRLVEVGES